MWKCRNLSAYIKSFKILISFKVSNGTALLSSNHWAYNIKSEDIYELRMFPHIFRWDHTISNVHYSILNHHKNGEACNFVVVAVKGRNSVFGCRWQHFNFIIDHQSRFHFFVISLTLWPCESIGATISNN